MKDTEEDVESKNLKGSLQMKSQLSEGAYTIRTEWEGNDNEQNAHPYSRILTNVVHEEGANLD